MATLYQLHSTMDTLRRSTEEMARTWHKGDSIVLLGTTVAFVDWFSAYLADNAIEGISAIYALADDVAQLTTDTFSKLQLETKLSGLLTDEEWVNLTQKHNRNDNDVAFDKVVTIAL